MAKQNFGGVYANMDFPPYVWVEYPKHLIVGPHGKYEIVNSKEEEAKLRERIQSDEDAAPAEYVPYVPDPEKEILLSRARELGLPFNSKWSKTKLLSIVEEAEAETDNLPAEVDQITSPDMYKEKLIAEARSLGIQATKLWGIPRLESHIASAKSKG